MFKELDIVRTTYDIPGVPVGSIGTIVYVHDHGYEKAYEVEFFENGETLCVRTMIPEELEEIPQSLEEKES